MNVTIPEHSLVTSADRNAVTKSDFFLLPTNLDGFILRHSSATVKTCTPEVAVSPTPKPGAFANTTAVYPSPNTIRNGNSTEIYWLVLLENERKIYQGHRYWLLNKSLFGSFFCITDNKPSTYLRASSRLFPHRDALSRTTTRAFTRCIRYCFMDDCSIFQDALKFTSLELLLQDGLNAIMEWANTNRVFFAPDKCKVLVHRVPITLSLTINGTLID